MKCLLQISIGPIQEFIASARRTSDLWYGSALLSNISKAVAKSVKEQSGKLIFPGIKELDEDSNISNIILAEIEIPEDKKSQSEEIIKTIYENAKKAGQDKWKATSEEVLEDKDIKNNINNIDIDLYNKQAEDAIEFYATVVPMNENYEDYREARKKLAKIFAGRKALRDFKQSKGNNKPKSSLDGRRESVLREDFTMPGIIKSKELKNSEQLCAIGLIKRIKGLAQKYPSVARITADCWIRQVKNSQEFKDFIEKCKCKEFNLSRIDETICKGKYYENFPFDGSFLFEDRYPQLIKEGYINEEQAKELKSLLQKLTKEYGKVYPYFAIIQADGDKMGEQISKIKSPDEHRAFSEKLAEFSAGVKNIVEENNGVCVYAGGDDVFAFLPLPDALKCARELRDSFIKNVPGATLSVGISVGHFMEPLEDLRNYAIQAEKLAKNNDDIDESERKNGISILINPRNGGKFHIREQWESKDKELPLDNKIKKYAQLFIDKKLPSKLPYDLRTLAASLKNRNITGENEYNYSVNQKIIEAEIKILLKRKQIDSQIAKGINTVKALYKFAEEMLVAQWFAMAQQFKEVK